MRSWTTALWLLTVLAAPLPRCVAGEEGSDAYEIAAAAALPALPQPLRAFFRQRVDAVRLASINERCTRGGATGCDGRHYLMLDAAARGPDPVTWHEAARSFPQDRRRAARLFRRNEIDIGGSLPWTVAEAYQQLVSAFRAQDVAVIVAATGTLTHYACDAALPFHGSRAGAGDLADRVQTGLIARLRARLNYEVRVAPTRYQETTAPVDAAFATMIRAHATLAMLMAADADVTPPPTNDSSAASLDVYYDHLMERTADLMEARLAAAALLSADLIGGAWAAADRPSLDGDSGMTTSAPGDTAPTPYVGSRGSTIYHRSGCPHARRIKPANRTGFSTAAAAIEAGRSPCKTCKPDRR